MKLLPDALFLNVHMYGIMVSVGILCAFGILYLYGKKLQIDARFLDFIFYDSIASVVVGMGSAALFQGLYDYIENPSLGFRLDGGITFIGGMIGGSICFVLINYLFRRKLTESYYNSRFAVIEDMKSTSVVVSENSHKETISEYAESFSTSKIIEDSVLAENRPIYSALISDNQYITMIATIHGISKTENILPVVNDDGATMPVEVELLEGRFFVSQDIFENRAVVVVDELTAEILSPGESCVGKTFTFGSSVGGMSIGYEDNTRKPVTVTVIGVVKNSNQSEVRRMTALKEKQNGEENIFINVSVYCPISTLTKLFSDSTIYSKYLYCFEDQHQFNEFHAYVDEIRAASERIGESIEVTTKESLANELESRLSHTKMVLNLITLVLCIISAISIMGIVFFSIKERIPEIGIRRAFGASKTDIAFQLILEMIIIAFAASAAAVPTSFYVCKIAEIFMVSTLFISFRIRVGAAQLILPVLVGIAEAIVCSIIPSLYAANIKVTDALKFE